MNAEDIVDEDKDEGGECARITTCEICLSLLCLVLIGIIGYSYYKVEEEIIPETPECLDSSCLKVAIQISEFLNESIDPCDDFHGFICGKFTENRYVDESPSIVEQELQQIQNRYKHFIITPPNDNDMEIVVLQKQFYQSCINLDGIDRGVDEYFWQLTEELGGWPMTMGRTWEENEFHWLKTMVKAKHLGLPFDWFIEIGVHSSDDGRQYLKLSPPEDCPEVEDVQEYLKFMVDVAVNMSISQIASSREFNKVLVFNEQLAKICQQYEGSDIEIGTISDLQAMFPKINWLALINDLTNGDFTDQSTIAYNIRGYIQELDLLLIRTARRVQANYIIWSMIDYYSQYLTQPIRERFHEFNIQNDTPCNEISRDEFCLLETQRHFKGVCEVAFIREILTDTVRENMEIVAQLFKESLRAFVEQLDWQSKDMKEEKMQEIDEQEIKIGGPDEIFDDNSVNYYLLIGKLQFNTTDPIEMLTLISQAHSDAIKEVISLENFTIYEQDLGNTTIFPIGILQGAFYNPNRPNYLNYQAIGSWYMKNHLEMIIDHWDPLKCRVKSTIGKHHNRNDYFSWDLIYEAYLKHVEKTGDDPLLPNLMQYNQQQLFWIYAGLLQCEREMNDKVNLMVRTSTYFSESFECSKNSLMNLEVKCN